MGSSPCNRVKQVAVACVCDDPRASTLRASKGTPPPPPPPPHFSVDRPKWLLQGQRPPPPFSVDRPKWLPRSTGSQPSARKESKPMSLGSSGASLLGASTREEVHLPEGKPKTRNSRARKRGHVLTTHDEPKDMLGLSGSSPNRVESVCF